MGGFSDGGTCALQLAVNYPEVYPTFIDSSGENQPTIRQGDQVLLQAYFGGSAAEFRKQNALDVIKTRKYPGTAGIISVGAADTFYRPQGGQVYQAMKSSGINVQFQAAPGGHAGRAGNRRREEHGLAHGPLGRHRLSRRRRTAEPAVVTR